MNIKKKHLENLKEKMLGRNLGGFSIGSFIPLVLTPPGPEGRVILMMPT
jgi:hypothetical protein